MSSAEKNREDLLALIPKDAKRVRVIDEKGHERWRDIEEEGFEAILSSDEIVLDDGRPRIMKSAPGRRKKKPPVPKPPPVSQTVAELMEAKSAYLDRDELLLQIEKGIDQEEVLALIMQGYAQEAASLAFERMEAERNGKETSQLSIRRIGALKALGETWIKRKEQLAGKTVDLASPAFGRLFEFILDTFREALHKGGISEDLSETIFVNISERINDETWEEEASRKMRGS